MSKFGAFGVNDAGTSKLTILNPKTGEPYRDSGGKEAFIEIAHLHGPDARAFDNENQRRLALLPDLPELNATESYMVRKLAGITKDWFLVGEDHQPIDVPLTFENAVEFYSNRWIRVQVIAHASAYANFSPPSPIS